MRLVISRDRREISYSNLISMIRFEAKRKYGNVEGKIASVTAQYICTCIAYVYAICLNMYRDITLVLAIIFFRKFIHLHVYWGDYFIGEVRKIKT